MPIPDSIDARLFYRCAYQRYDDAKVLRNAEHTTGAVYLAGYGVECILKALILNAVPSKRRKEILNSFRGAHAHDYNWLRDCYLANGGARFPPAVTRQFTLVNEWSTNLRYVPRTYRSDEADSFLVAVESIIQWAAERL